MWPNSLLDCGKNTSPTTPCAQTCTASAAAIEERRVTTGYEWGQVFGDAVAATAILDRLLHHSQVITIRGDSYR
jgi:hypothetical protein